MFYILNKYIENAWYFHIDHAFFQIYLFLIETILALYKNGTKCKVDRLKTSRYIVQFFSIKCVN